MLCDQQRRLHMQNLVFRVDIEAKADKVFKNAKHVQILVHRKIKAPEH
jgi:hypothetical protein